MQNTSHKSCQRLAELLVQRGAEYAVVSPGSRNAPLLIALSRESRLKKVVIVDERSAGFVALGISQATDKPVAVVCTSGTALLNLAPAVAEAYYQHLPLIVVSADRPKEWIDQNDSQTLRQDAALKDFVKGEYCIESLIADDTQSWYVNRILNEALGCAMAQSPGPVHINMHISEPLCALDDEKSGVRFIEAIAPSFALEESIAQELSQLISESAKVMVVCGHMQPDAVLNELIRKFAEHPNVVVLAETLSCVQGGNVINRIDTVMSAMQEDESANLAPDILIYIGGAPVSKLMKLYLRKYAVKEQWRVGVDENVIDTMQGITKRISITPRAFFESIADINNAANSDYKQHWQQLEQRAYQSHERYIDSASWSSLKAVSIIAANLPKNADVQLSNGLTVRLMQLFAPSQMRYSCNRGVSGIDGSTSTALGASIASGNDVLLVTGDMSFSYDINGLSSQYNSKRLKIIVLCNDGGGIFRFINGPSTLPELEQYFEVNRAVPVEKYAAAFGYDFYEADSEDSLRREMEKFYDNEAPSILAVKTPNVTDAEILRNYYNRQNK